ncbi:MAG: signal peptidase I [Hespellia sp.]|nr:signal peptidase I [Hespellia sp.]
MRKKIGFSRSRGKRKRTFEREPIRELHFRKEKTKYQVENKRNLVSWIVQTVIIIIIAAVLVLYFGQRVNNMGDSMTPVLKNGDVVLTNRIIYDAGQPKRGDIIAFKPNGNDNASYRIKRIIGLPGETVQLKDGVVYINGKQLKENYKTTVIDDVGIAGEEITLEGNEYFVLGDNRSSGDDSRQANIGNVKRSEIYGKVWFIIKSRNKNFGFLK